ncbi:MAG: alpha-ketoglutarate-dependent dioxygenase AlkB [Sulfobacillus sp.]
MSFEPGDRLFASLWDLRPPEYAKVRMFGKIVETPRWQRSFGKPYFYSGMQHDASPIEHPYLLRLLDFVRRDSGRDYQQILMNWYLDGRHYIGPHADETKHLVPNSTIYSFSFGAERTFRVTKKDDGSLVADFPMAHGSFLLMGGEMQKWYKHQVPKCASVRSPRINVTFRLFK